MSAVQSPLEPEPESGRCRNCNEPLRGAYCYICGQPAQTGRYTILSLAQEFYKSFTKVDGLPTLRTFWALTTRGGDFCREYLAGCRIRYTNPVKYYFYVFVIGLILRAILLRLTHDEGFRQMSVEGTHLQVFYLVMSVFWGTLWWIFFRRSGMNLPENVICAIFFTAHINLFVILTTFALSPLIELTNVGRGFSSAVGALGAIAYFIFFSRRLFNEPIWLLVPKQLVMIVIYVIAFIAFFVADFEATRLIESRFS